LGLYFPRADNPLADFGAVFGVSIGRHFIKTNWHNLNVQINAVK
jgi:hypothetical protein